MGFRGRATAGRRGVVPCGILLVAVAGALVSRVASPAPADDTAPPRPNIVVFFVDNLGHGDLGCTGSTLHVTPHIDRLAAEGTRLTSFYSASGVCTPSRAALLTGCYPRRVGMHESAIGGAVLQPVAARGLHPDEVTIAEVLRSAGYATGIFGKWHLGDQPAFLPTRQGFDEYVGIPYSDDMTPREDKPWPDLPLVSGETVVESPVDRDLLARRCTAAAVDFIDRHADEPFFLYLPHPMPGSTRHPFASAAFKGRSANGPYGDSVEELDWATGEILAALDRHDLAPRTLVVWTSDNGAPRRTPPQGSCAPYRGHGYDTSEGAMRMPCLVRWPGHVPSGRICDALCSTMDLLPTFAALAGATPPKHPIDGHDIREILLGTGGADATASPWDVEGFGYYRLGQLQAVRAGRWRLDLPLEAKYVTLGRATEPAPVALHDVAGDVGQEYEVSAAHPDVVARLTALAEGIRAEIGDVDRPGRGERPAGHVDDPQPLVAAPPADAPGSRSPNVVFILADDLGYRELGCFGQKKIRTPRLDGLAAEGMRLTRHYAGNAVCAPSRCVLLTGRHPGHAFVRDNKSTPPEGQQPIPAEEVTLAELLHDAGYVTGGFGKWGLGGPGSAGEPLRQGFDRFFGYNCQSHAHSYYPAYLWDDATRIPLKNDPPVPGHAGLPAGADPADPRSYDVFKGCDYAPDRIHAAALEFVRANRDRPFFLYYPSIIPHVALHVPDDELAPYLALAWNDPPFTRPRGGYTPHFTPRAAYAAMISRLDREVGAILDTLEDLGLTDETLVIFSSDNGTTHLGDEVDVPFFASVGDLRGLKGSLYEGGIRVPTIVRWPGHVAPGSTSDFTSGFEDWLPTILDAVGHAADVPAGCDGTSLVPVLEGRPLPPRPFLYREFGGYGGQQAVWSGRWKGVRQRLARGPAPTELYDLSVDETESRDVAADHADVVADLEAIMAREHTPSAIFRIKGLDGEAADPGTDRPARKAARERARPATKGATR
jgi:arylsulfatase A